MNRSTFEHWLSSPDRPPLVMGILNLTPDSFSDGGRYTTAQHAIQHAREMRAQGAHWIDLGAESTRPGAAPVPPDEQIARILPVLSEIDDLGVILSVDTTSAEVASAALDHGAQVVNDISAARFDPRMLPLVAERNAAIILMHIQGTPATMQRNPTYRDVVGEVVDHLRQRRNAAADAGIAPHRILLDPGIGFGKTLEHNLRLLREMHALVQLGQPVVMGTSRKGFIGQVTGEQPAERRLPGTAATVAWSIANGASVVRVHDVGAMVAVTRMIAAIRGIPYQDPT